MKTALNKSIAGLLVASSILGNGCSEKVQEVYRERSPTPMENQRLILHPDPDRWTDLGYTLLTDLDSDGKWDVAKRVQSGFAFWDDSKEVFIKEGYEPARSAPRSEGKVSIVSPEFFKQFPSIHPYDVRHGSHYQ